MTEEEDVFDFTNIKKQAKTKKPVKKVKEAVVKDVETDSWADPNKYETMLERIFKILKDGRTNSSESKKLSLPSIQLEPVGLKKHKKYLWKNFGEFANQLNRPIEHLREYFSTQLSIDPFVTDEQGLKLEGRRLEKEELQTILIKYIHEYVKCPMCMSSKTSMIKDSNLRVYVINCESCKAQRSLAQIKTVKK